MKKIFALMSLAAMMSGWDDVYRQQGYNRPSHIQKPLSDKQKDAIHKSYERNMHDYNIKGTIIRSKDRKTALKIYANRTKRGKKNEYERLERQ